MTGRRLFGLSPSGLGMAMMAAAMLMAPGIDALAKLLGERIPPMQIACVRFFIQSLMLAPCVLLLEGPEGFKTKRLGLHMLRGALIAMAVLMFFTGLTYLPMADAIAIFFLEPLILTLISWLFLGETVGWRRLLAISAGFGGALLIIRPNFIEVGWPVFLPMGTALAFAIYLALTRFLANDVSALAMQTFSGMAATALLGLMLGVGAAYDYAPFTPKALDASLWMMLVGLGVVAIVSHLLIAMAFRKANASVLAPFQYLEIISATFLGYLVFGDFPDAITWAGVFIIMASGLYIFVRENALDRKSVKTI